MKRLILLAPILAASALLAAQTQTPGRGVGDPAKAPPPAGAAVEPPSASALATVTIHPKRDDTMLLNPGKGWVQYYLNSESILGFASKWPTNPTWERRFYAAVDGFRSFCPHSLSGFCLCTVFSSFSIMVLLSGISASLKVGRFWGRVSSAGSQNSLCRNLLKVR